MLVSCPDEPVQLAHLVVGVFEVYVLIDMVGKECSRVHHQPPKVLESRLELRELVGPNIWDAKCFPGTQEPSLLSAQLEILVVVWVVVKGALGLVELPFELEFL